MFNPLKTNAARCVITASLVLVAAGLQAGPIFINEIHYDNAGADVGEFVEVAGIAGTDLQNWSLVFYNGAIQQVYNTVNLSGVIDNEGDGFGALPFFVAGIQNGAPDGIALVDSGSVVEFLSYEGAFTALDGPAAGIFSVDIGVAESSATPVGSSLQKTGTGTMASDFSWAGQQSESPGVINAGQRFVASVPEPSTLALMAIGLAGIGFARKQTKA